MTPRVTSFAPQFLVDDLERSIGYYEKLGFTFDEPWDGFYVEDPDGYIISFGGRPTAG